MSAVLKPNSILMDKMLKIFKKDQIELSPQQLAVIRWVIEGKGSLKLIARAGCGKTFTLLEVAKTIVALGLGDVACMAYNKKIADEIKFKFEKIGYDWKVAQAGTCHSFGFAAWRKVAPHVKVVKRGNDKLDAIITQCGLEKGGAIYTQNHGALVKLVSLAKQRALGHIGEIEDMSQWFDIWDHFGLDDDVTEDVIAEELIKCAIKIYRISLNQCRDYIDFDDMILAPLYFKARFWPKKWILLDESQDTNLARRALALAMLDPKYGRMLFVGDDCQAIYGFTGADSDAMDLLKKATNAITLPLNVTRRCPKKVVALAKTLVPDFIAHEDAPEGVVRALAYGLLEGENLGSSDAILCRNTAPLITTAYKLLSKGIGCRVEGREIGEGLIKLARRWKVKTLDKLLNKLEDYEARQTANFKSKGQEHRIDGLIDQVSCLRVIIDRCLFRKQNMIDDLVADIDEMFGDTAAGEKPEVLTLSTVHKSKGREWKRVYILGRAKYMPSPYAKKEWQQIQEKNLEYVAITRAQSEMIDLEAPTQE